MKGHHFLSFKGNKQQNLCMRGNAFCLGLFFRFALCLLQPSFVKAIIGLVTPLITPYKAKNICVKG